MSLIYVKTIVAYPATIQNVKAKSTSGPLFGRYSLFSRPKESVMAESAELMRIGGQDEMLLPIPGKKGKEAAASKPVARAGTRQKKVG
jgi:hypothetical protein